MQVCITAFMISINLLAKTSFSDVPLGPAGPLLAKAEDALRLADLRLIHSWYSKTCVQLRCCSLLLVLTTFAEDRWLLNVVFVSLFKSIELQTRLTVQVLRRCIALLLVQQHQFPDFHRFDALLSLSALNMQRLHILYNYKTKKNNIPWRYVPSLSLLNAVYPGTGVCVKEIVKKNNNNSTRKQKKHVYHPAPVEKWADIRIFWRRSMSEFKAQDLVATLTETQRV